MVPYHALKAHPLGETINASVKPQINVTENLNTFLGRDAKEESDQVAQATALLFRLAKSEECSHDKYRELRKATQAFFDMFSGHYNKKRAFKNRASMKNMLQRHRQQMKKHDQQYIIESGLRAQRLADLKALQCPIQDHLCVTAPGSESEFVSDSKTKLIAQIPQVLNDELIAENELLMSLKREQGWTQRELFYPRSCYCCKRRFTKLHFFYDLLCMKCAELNWCKREATANLNGKVVLLTGARVKIGFECGKKLLQCGATLIATSRFPHDMAKRYAMLPDFEVWKHRLHIFGIDLRDLRATVRFTEILLSKYNRLDAIVNNAAQTVRRPPIYYQHLAEAEAQPKNTLSIPIFDVHLMRSSRALLESDRDTSQTTQNALCVNTQSWSSAGLSQVNCVSSDLVHDESLFPNDSLDVNGQQVDLRQRNSWTLLLAQIEPAEIVEVFAVNALSPFIICSRLKPLMLKVKDCDKFIVNVSAMEGKFYRHKGPQHPHTNMAKAALNQLVRTSAQDYATDRIYMSAVDTGWINDENPFDVCVKNAKNNWHTPIDEIDAMARVLDPILNGFANGCTEHGVFFKDYLETEW